MRKFYFINTPQSGIVTVHTDSLAQAQREAENYGDPISEQTPLLGGMGIDLPGHTIASLATLIP